LLNPPTNVRRVKNVRQIEIHTAEPLIPEPGPFEVETAIAKLKKYKSPGSDQISAKLIQAGGEALQSEIHKLINSVWSKEELTDQWKEFIIVAIWRRMIKLTVVFIEEHQFYQLHTKFYPTSFSRR
jgi:hypothetical protein